jgi:hypothetical protein
MALNPQEKILEILGLNKEEKILHEYESFLVESLLIMGTLYLTDNYICFYSNLLFFNRNIAIPLKEVTEISFVKPNIEINTKTKKYSITSKTEIDTILAEIKSICKNFNENNKNKADINQIIIDSGDLVDANKDENSSTNVTDSSNSASKDLSFKDEEEIEFEPIDPEQDYEAYKKIIDISPKEFFNKFYSDTNEETNTLTFCNWAGGHTNIKISGWEKIENNENSEIEKFKKTESFTLALHGVPMVDHSDIVKNMTYYIKKDGTYIFKISTINKGVPSSDCFTIEATTELYPYKNGTKTIYRAYVRTNFIKSTFLKYMIASQTKKSFKNEVDKWLEFIQLKGTNIEGDYTILRRRKNPSANADLEEKKKDKETTSLFKDKIFKNKIFLLSILFLLVAIILILIMRKNN